ncbi:MULTISPECIES: prepilin-type N-terminal cleavage/methylation domain-containing protein [Pseudoalteromonas]|uniref:Mannose-sensitive agglutinin (MSHA) biogenesis protein MshD (Pilus type IV) n=1 Tax=Pseudoalteromonas translucida (strain TAC 125) TaxID=326442 RepID=Q3IFI9_PSET1|nr:MULTISPECIES: prepilin-type N-terminal cleavage/methylation domain-containing protein [Pseudoalteromonas]MBB1405590.1 prepilin-type N-terminal cleavage/methylation domain-containing protein [Pseudoalteromonas sp. SG44-5]MBE0418842.1 prepilin-type N-terminal cleavage/methylation domain-containing protein [Pseudoalteromonas nigrifaciens]MBH0091876.1 prepilin-type N-terminal cleavage/methylation domain-containing protein [Pseudoalteromonas sp. SCQQ13]CAI87735.1 putative Mannose-sensitive agglut
MPALKHKGFTLIELIVGIVMFAIALSIITALIAPQAQKSAEPIVALRASEFGQSLMNEIQSKSFDEYSERSAPFRRCGEISLGAKACTAAADLGPDNSETRTSYNDVDDYIALSGQPITNSLGVLLPQYSGFSLVVKVQYDSDFNDATSNDGSTFKRITIEVTSPLGEVYGFSAYKGNY